MLFSVLCCVVGRRLRNKLRRRHERQGNRNLAPSSTFSGPMLMKVNSSIAALAGMSIRSASALRAELFEKHLRNNNGFQGGSLTAPLRSFSWKRLKALLVKRSCNFCPLLVIFSKQRLESRR